ncbi:tetratricopeptide repeat protein [Pyruvatibacter mobilis]|uniref:tetratricopeptide repeat protein n=1 Tax=Pyruvatibacter mobilis TaxID=1712261 RepID=UPI003C7A1947
MSDIFREVEEDLRRERYESLWDTYGAYVIGGAVALIVAVGAVSWWNASTKTAAEDAARAFVAADQLAEEGNTEEAAAAFATLAEEGNGGYEAVAGIRAAGLMAEAGDVDGAVARLDAIAAGGGDDTLRSLAALRAAMLLADTASIDDLNIRLAPLAEEGEPFRFSALELLGFAALKAGDEDAAANNFQMLADAAGAPPLMRERARDMLRGLQVDGPVARQLPATPAGEANEAGEADDTGAAEAPGTEENASGGEAQ